METESRPINKSPNLHVQFTDDTDKYGHDSDIAIHYANDSLINIHLGFLQISHRYGITFRFKCPDSIEGSLIVRNQDSPCPNLHVHVVDLRPAEKPNNQSSSATHTTDDQKSDSIKYQISIELFAHKEKLLKQQICLHSSENASQTCTLVFHARVLGKGKGTPFLKNGITSIGIEMDEDDDDNSDWQGFNN